MPPKQKFVLLNLNEENLMKLRKNNNIFLLTIKEFRILQILSMLDCKLFAPINTSIVK